MIFAYITAALGVAVWFVPEGWRWPFVPVGILLMALYVRTMNRRARRDAQ